jgi:hypothetical protein
MKKVAMNMYSHVNLSGFFNRALRPSGEEAPKTV